MTRSYFLRWFAGGALLLLFFTFITAGASGVDERIGSAIPGSILMTDSEGSTLPASEIFSIPTLLMPVYYSCPDICAPMMHDLSEVLPEIRMKPGIDYQVVTFSFDYNETPEAAGRAKAQHTRDLPPEFPRGSWRFLTGDSLNVNLLLSAIGFSYTKKGNNIAHPTFAAAISPGRKITRYLYGIRFLPFDLQMSLMDAAKEKSGISIQKVVRLCFSYDPEGRKYVLNTTRVVGVVMLAVLLIFFLLIIFIRKSDAGHARGGK